MHPWLEEPWKRFGFKFCLLIATVAAAVDILLWQIVMIQKPNDPKAPTKRSFCADLLEEIESNPEVGQKLQETTSY
jgi:hypothetical protein